MRWHGLTLHRLAATALAVAAAGLVPAVAAAHPLNPADADHDGIVDHQDNCPDAFNPGQEDTDADGEPPRLPGAASTSGGDSCDTDDDGDGVDDALDNCRLAENPGQRDDDGDGDGDVCDTDDDADGVPDRRDNCVRAPNPDQADRDDDFIGDACDPQPGPAGPPVSGPSGPAPAPAGPASAAPAPAAPPVPDRVAPRIAVSVSRSHRADELLAGLAVAVRVSEPARLSALLTMDRRSARRLGLRGRRRSVARGANPVAEAGRTFVFARFAPGALRRLARARSVRLSLRVTARDAAGNARVVTRTVWVRA